MILLVQISHTLMLQTGWPLARMTKVNQQRILLHYRVKHHRESDVRVRLYDSLHNSQQVNNTEYTYPDNIEEMPK